MTVRLICVAGAESTGKSWLAHRLAAHFGIGHVTEYARGYCAAHGNALSPDQLLHIGQTQDRMIRDALRAAERDGQSLVITDTDALVTAVWTQLAHADAVPAWFAGPLVHADLTLVTAVDLPWRDDGVRIQRNDDDRHAFTAKLLAVLDSRNRRRAMVTGTGEARFTNALAAIEAHLPPC